MLKLEQNVGNFTRNTINLSSLMPRHALDTEPMARIFVVALIGPLSMVFGEGLSLIGVHKIYKETESICLSSAPKNV